MERNQRLKYRVTVLSMVGHLRYDASFVNVYGANEEEATYEALAAHVECGNSLSRVTKVKISRVTRETLDSLTPVQVS